MVAVECARQGRGTIYRPVSNISNRSTHSGADLVRTKSLRATIKYPLEQAVGSDLRSILSVSVSRLALSIQSRHRFARLTKIFASKDLLPSSFFQLCFEPIAKATRATPGLPEKSLRWNGQINCLIFLHLFDLHSSDPHYTDHSTFR